MRAITLKGVLARKLRLTLTALSIVLGVTFVTGTLILGDTLNRTFDNLIGTVYQHVSFEVRGDAKLVSTTNAAAAGVDSTAFRRPVPHCPDGGSPGARRRVRLRIRRWLRPVR
jgi:putative ABC transport system permease protein